MASEDNKIATVPDRERKETQRQDRMSRLSNLETVTNDSSVNFTGGTDNKYIKCTASVIEGTYWADEGGAGCEDEDGITYVGAYQSQAIILTSAEQEAIPEIIRGLHYVIPPSAIGAPTSHKLYKTTIKKAASDPESISWPIFLILSTVYNKLPAKYITEIRRVHGRTSTEDLTREYLAIEGMEPAEPVTQPNTSATNNFRADLHNSFTYSYKYS